MFLRNMHNYLLEYSADDHSRLMPTAVGTLIGLHPPSGHGMTGSSGVTRPSAEEDLNPLNKPTQSSRGFAAVCHKQGYVQIGRYSCSEPREAFLSRTWQTFLYGTWLRLLFRNW
jgi:hypothetical protein